MLLKFVWRKNILKEEGSINGVFKKGGGVGKEEFGSIYLVVFKRSGYWFSRYYDFER